MLIGFTLKLNITFLGDFPVSDKPGDWYPEHILSWYHHRDNKTVYFLYYEDMKKVKTVVFCSHMRFVNQMLFELYMVIKLRLFHSK